MSTGEKIRKDMYEEIADNIASMSNKDAADILKTTRLWMNVSRGNGKSIQSLIYNVAMNKAIHALEHMPDEIEKKDGERKEINK